VFSAAREAAEAAASPVVPVRAPHASAAAAASSKDPLAAMVAAMNEVVRNMKTSGSRQSSADFNAIVDTTLAAGIQALGIAADATSVVAPPAGEAIRGMQSAASAVAMQRTIGELEAALAGLSPPATAGRAPTAKGADGSAAGAAAPGAPSAVAAAGTAPGSSAPSADELRRVLLSPTVPARTPVGAAPGASESAAAAEPEELAWLVNEALVEQARRHGVDLS
jgi:hypothetical protein